MSIEAVRRRGRGRRSGVVDLGRHPVGAPLEPLAAPHALLAARAELEDVGAARLSPPEALEEHRARGPPARAGQQRGGCAAHRREDLVAAAQSRPRRARGAAPSRAARRPPTGPGPRRREGAGLGESIDSTPRSGRRGGPARRRTRPARCRRCRRTRAELLCARAVGPDDRLAALERREERRRGRDVDDGRRQRRLRAVARRVEEAQRPARSTATKLTRRRRARGQATRARGATISAGRRSGGERASTALIASSRTRSGCSGHVEEVSLRVRPAGRRRRGTTLRRRAARRRARRVAIRRYSPLAGTASRLRSSISRQVRGHGRRGGRAADESSGSARRPPAVAGQLLDLRAEVHGARDLVEPVDVDDERQLLDEGPGSARRDRRARAR